LPYRAFIFDLDGTLVSLPVDWEAVRAKLRLAFSTDDSFSPLFQTLERFLAERPEVKKKVFALIDEDELDAVGSAALIDEADDILRVLSGRASLGLVTMQGRRACNVLLGKFGLRDLLSFWITREDSLLRSHQIEVAVRRLGAQKSDVLFVGDRLNDVNAARQVGVAVALVGRRGVARLKPDLHFRNILEFRSGLKTLVRPSTGRGAPPEGQTSPRRGEGPQPRLGGSRPRTTQSRPGHRRRGA